MIELAFQLNDSVNITISSASSQCNLLPRAISPMITKLLAIALLIVFILKNAHSAAVQASSRKLSLPIHGIWCGPGHGGTLTSNTPCIDQIDCKCKAHDQCWDKHTQSNCKCDDDLVSALEADVSPVAVAIRDWFTVSPCVGPVSLTIPRFCERCVTVLGKRVCPQYPCGIMNKCEMIPLLNKRSAIAYTCIS